MYEKQTEQVERGTKQNLPIFKNIRLSDAGYSIDEIAFYCFWGSSLTTALGIGWAAYMGLAQYLPAYIYDPKNVIPYWGYIAASAIVWVKFARIIDFHGVEKMTQLAASEFTAYASGLYQFNKARILQMLSFSAIALIAIFFSYATSYKGSDLVAGMLKGKNGNEMQSLSNYDNELKKNFDATIKPFQQRLDAIRLQMDNELKSSGNKELRKLAANGNTWAIDEIKAIEAKINARYSKELAAAQAQYEKVFNSAQEDKDKKAKLALANAESIAKSTNSQNDALTTIFLLCGTVCLIVGVVMVVTREMMRVTIINEEQAKAQPKK